MRINPGGRNVAFVFAAVFAFCTVLNRRGADRIDETNRGPGTGDRGHRTFLRSCRLHCKLMTGRFSLIGFVRMLAKVAANDQDLLAKRRQSTFENELNQ